MQPSRKTLNSSGTGLKLCTKVLSIKVNLSRWFPRFPELRVRLPGFPGLKSYCFGLKYKIIKSLRDSPKSLLCNTHKYNQLSCEVSWSLHCSFRLFRLIDLKFVFLIIENQKSNYYFNYYYVHQLYQSILM